MTCRRQNCLHQFCYVCLGDWSGHDMSNCHAKMNSDVESNFVGLNADVPTTISVLASSEMRSLKDTKEFRDLSYFCAQEVENMKLQEILFRRASRTLKILHKTHPHVPSELAVAIFALLAEGRARVRFTHVFCYIHYPKFREEEKFTLFVRSAHSTLESTLNWFVRNRTFVYFLLRVRFTSYHFQN